MTVKGCAQIALGILLLGGATGALAGSPIASAPLQTADGSPAGSATLTAKADGLKLHIAAKGLAPGEHGIHLHTTGLCETPGFTSAGGHLNPFNKHHGSLNPQGRHLGDLPNLQIGPDGTGSLDVQLDGAAKEIEPLLFDSDGTAIVIHATADDLKSDPSGNSGGRIACGVLKKGS